MIIKLHFTEAYQLAAFIIKIVQESNISDEYLDFLEPRNGNFLSKVAKPHKVSLLHDFIYNINIDILDYSTGHFASCSVQEYKSILNSLNYELPDWLSEEKVVNYIPELDSLLKKATQAITDATFHILFSDKEFLSKFQNLLAKKLLENNSNEKQIYFSQNNRLMRPTYLPSWLKKAIIARDKCMCQICFSDLTGIMITNKKLHFDHLRPLYLNGTNDPTNFQLLCSQCNQTKGKKNINQIYYTTPYW